MPARAAGEIVLEAYTGERPADANRLLWPVLDELGAHNEFSAGDTVARQIDAQVSRAAAARQRAAGETLPRRSTRDFKAWVAGKFDEAIKILVPLVDTAHANSGAFVRDPSLREPLHKALIGLAIAQSGPVIRARRSSTFGEVAARVSRVDRCARHVRAARRRTLFDQVKREIAAAGKGKLTVKAADEGAVVFIDEQCSRHVDDASSRPASIA